MHVSSISIIHPSNQSFLYYASRGCKLYIKNVVPTPLYSAFVDINSKTSQSIISVANVSKLQNDQIV